MSIQGLSRYSRPKLDSVNQRCTTTATRKEPPLITAREKPVEKLRPSTAKNKRINKIKNKKEVTTTKKAKPDSLDTVLREKNKTNYLIAKPLKPMFLIKHFFNCGKIYIGASQMAQ